MAKTESFLHTQYSITPTLEYSSPPSLQYCRLPHLYLNRPELKFSKTSKALTLLTKAGNPGARLYFQDFSKINRIHPPLFPCHSPGGGSPACRSLHHPQLRSYGGRVGADRGRGALLRRLCHRTESLPPGRAHLKCPDETVQNHAGGVGVLRCPGGRHSHLRDLARAFFVISCRCRWFCGTRGLP
jgi:hypothetical protein